MALVLIDLAPELSLATVAALDAGPICVCDSYIVGAEKWNEVVGGWATGRFLNVDHHAPSPRMARQVSSANLALARIREGEPPAGAAPGLVVVTHTDCDSVLSGGMMSGRLEPRPDYGDAAIAADHTGRPHPIADLLQALDAQRDLDLSLDSLARLERGESLPDAVRALLDHRRRARTLVTEAVDAGRIQTVEGLAVGVLDEALDGEFFPAALPDAAIIVVCSPWPSEPGRWEVKVRLGQAAPDGLALDVLPWQTIDPMQLGRWNARSNKRGGGTRLPPDVYLDAVRAAWSQFLRTSTGET